MLDAGAKVTVRAHKVSVRKLLSKTLDSETRGTLERSIQAHKKAEPGGNRYILVYPTGPHHTYSGVEKTKAYKRSKHGRTYTVGGGEKVATANDVGFVNEYGAPRRGIKASEWMKKANEQCEPEVEAAEMAVYDRWLESINL